MNVIWLDEPPYVMTNTCPDCYPGCRLCTLCDCCCACEACYEERQQEEW
jgi:hypothetical protein